MFQVSVHCTHVVPFGCTAVTESFDPSAKPLSLLMQSSEKKKGGGEGEDVKRRRLVFFEQKDLGMKMFC